MYLIPIRLHAVLDYLVGLLLIAAPWIFGIPGDTIASAVCVTMGFTTLLYSLFTDYKLSVWRAIPFNAHLVMDLLSGIFLLVMYAASMTTATKWPLAAIGGLEIAVVIFTGFRSDPVAEAHAAGHIEPNRHLATSPATDRHV